MIKGKYPYKDIPPIIQGLVFKIVGRKFSYTECDIEFIELSDRKIEVKVWEDKKSFCSIMVTRGEISDRIRCFVRGEKYDA